jgi:hypothetical protein
MIPTVCDNNSVIITITITITITIIITYYLWNYGDQNYYYCCCYLLLWLPFTELQ